MDPDIVAKLKKLECPINWHLEKTNIGNAEKKLLNRSGSDSRSDKGDGSSTWQEISLFLSLAYLEYRSSDDDNKMNEHLKHVKKICEERQELYPLIKRYLQSVNYILKCMWTHYYQKNGHIEDVERNLKLISPFEKLNVKEKAGILAIKACCFMAFGPYENSDALEAIENALELDGDEAEWSFLKGKCLARTRRCLKFRSSPTDEELACLRKAVDKDGKSPSHLVFFALSLQERGLNDTSGDKKKYMDESYKFFKRGAAYSFHSPTSLARIARGLMRTLHLGGPNLKLLVENCVKRSCQLCPDSGLVNHVAANFYSKVGHGKEKQLEKCLFHLRKAAFECGVYGAYMNLFDMHMAHKTLIDIDVVANNFWEEFKDVPVDRFKALKPMTAYYFYHKKDIVKATALWKEWMQSPKNTDKDGTNSLFVKTDSLTAAISRQVRKELQENISLSSEEREEIQMFLEVADEFYKR